MPEPDECELKGRIAIEDAPATDEMATLECEEMPECEETLDLDGDGEPEVEDDTDDLDGVGAGMFTLMLVLDAVRSSCAQMLSSRR